MAAQSAVVPSVQEPVSSHHSSSGQPLSPTSSSDSHSMLSEDEPTHDTKYPNHHLARPKLGSRKSSGTMIVPREKAVEVISDAEYDENDVRTMSPRRNSSEVDQLGEDARRDLREQAKTLQMSLQDIVNKMEMVKSEQEKLEAGNKFLQSYIGELMQTSRITSNPTKSKGKGRGVR